MAQNNVSPRIEKSAELPVEMSARVRLARNVRHIPFPHMARDDDALDAVLEKLSTAFDDYQKVSMNMLKFEDKALLVEKHLSSPLFTRQCLHSFINEDDSASIMINEVDHVRIPKIGACV